MAEASEKTDAGEPYVTMAEAVNDMKNEEEHTIAVFGAGDETNCTYIMGYMDRQAIFSCKTCDPLTENPSGVCYACSLSCHHDHDLVELYTKRNFKCDCGNSKFTGFKCKLQEKKDDLNEKNRYNHNFEGKYCTCDRPYPDTEEVEDEMIQCIVCEDWFHSRHLGCLPPVSYEEMVCDGCVTKYLFLQKYNNVAECPLTHVESKEATESVDITTCSPSKKRKKTTEDDENPGPSSSSNFKCKLKSSDTEKKEKLQLKAMFFKSNWRNELCQCPDCLGMYDKEKLYFLLNKEDTIAAYEEKGKEKTGRVMDSAANHISQMNHVQQVELMRGYQDLKDNLSDFLKGFSAEDKVVTKEDIEVFFEDLNKKRRERQNGFPHTSCK